MDDIANSVAKQIAKNVAKYIDECFVKAFKDFEGKKYVIDVDWGAGIDKASYAYFDPTLKTWQYNIDPDEFEKLLEDYIKRFQNSEATTPKPCDCGAIKADPNNPNHATWCSTQEDTQ